MAVPKGCLITLEGSDGSGKTTHLNLLETRLNDRGISVITTREPGGTQLGEALRDLLLQGEFECNAETETLILFAARAHNLDTVIRPAIELGKWVICDRFTDATFAYQGGGGGLDFQRISQLEMFVQQGIQPDLTLLLDLPIDQGLARTVQRGGYLDRFEKQDIAFKERVRQAYLTRQSNHPARIRLIDASETVDRVHKSIWKHINLLIQKDQTA
jgi:dTMP kinase